MKPARQAKALAAPVEPTPAPSAPPSSAAAVPSVPAESSPAPAQAVAPAPPVPAPPAHPAPPAKTSVSIPATYAASNRKPEYPTMSRRYEEQGTVVLRVFVKEDGTAGDVEIKKSSGYPLLDKSAKSTVQTWRFNPATSNGKPVAEWYQLSIPFKLQD
jgi:protein TonB